MRARPLSGPGVSLWLLEDFDHMYRYAALMDRVEGKDAEHPRAELLGHSPRTSDLLEHRHPHDDLRQPYDRTTAAFLTKLHALTIMAGEHQTHDYYMTIGPMFADPGPAALCRDCLH